LSCNFLLLEKKSSALNCLFNIVFYLHKSLFFLSNTIVCVVVNIVVFSVIKTLVCNIIDILIKNANSVAIDNATNNAINYIIK